MILIQTTLLLFDITLVVAVLAGANCRINSQSIFTVRLASAGHAALRVTGTRRELAYREGQTGIPGVPVRSKRATIGELMSY
jgi:hypothetical protein